MRRDEQLAFCKKCSNRKMDVQQGLLCNLTGEKATFTNECPDFILDPTVKVELNDTEPLENQDIRAKLSTDAYERLRIEQNLPMAIISGSIAGLIGAILWGVITVATNYQIGYMAIAIGAGVGFSMRYFGKGVDQIFGISGGLIAILSCAVGNFLSVMGFVAQAEGLGYFETLTRFDYSFLIPVMTETFSAMDILFYAFAGYEGYKFAFRVFTEKELSTVK
ncbi:hypothetical protein [Roseivirga sp.]|uniref:hypothetical protein n=1 Tax=Roseivirga sp. TaxID=1964215 RepID=UPI002B270571|nr:hypothetical protein [Roseivirga sp.]